MRSELAQVEVLRCDPEDGGKAPAGALQAPVGPEQARADGVGSAGLGEAHEFVERARAHERVAVQEQQPAPARDGGSAVVARAEAHVLGQGDEAHLRVLAREPRRRAVLRGLVDDDRLDGRTPLPVGRQGGQAPRQQVAALVAHDHDGDVGHARRRLGLSRPTAQRPRPRSGRRRRSSRTASSGRRRWRSAWPRALR